MLISLILFSFQSFAAHRDVATPLAHQFQPGTVVIRTSERALYLILDSEGATRYPIAVPKAGKQWSAASAEIVSKQRNPAWQAPAEVLADHPELNRVIPGGDEHNPMGVAAIGLSLPEIYIHGTAPGMRKSIGTAASYGCIRMLNEDVSDLYERVNPGTPIVLIH